MGVWFSIFFYKIIFLNYLVLRITYYTFGGMNQEKRNVRTYKVKDAPYFEALEKSKDKPLANKIEEVVQAIADGKQVVFKSSKPSIK
jgi:hypothetical protein